MFVVHGYTNGLGFSLWIYNACLNQIKIKSHFVPNPPIFRVQHDGYGGGVLPQTLHLRQPGITREKEDMMKNLSRILMLMTALGLGGVVMKPDAAHARDRDRAPVGACRDYTRSVFDGNYTQISYGTACRRRDGNWYVVNETFKRPRFYDQNDRMPGLFVVNAQNRGPGLYDRGYVIYDRDWDRDDRRRDRNSSHNHGYNKHTRH